ncbi:hypothetical protein [Desulfovibrio sp. Huiquan2017]|uniref:P-loop ATPase, Sll1717 family n=1 Tax=Desulfovibrio sp. Huiquan2017 TaxID=2816861 RepID=UPI001A9298F0|nr:hypothetical protein [Desulfovibrio sp. Huiquan2017]
MSNPFLQLQKEAKAGRLKIKNVFSEENIRKMFGHEAAEDEDVARLKEYYFKNDIYEQVAADLKLRVLVGHKGIGKSALFKIAAAEDVDKGILPIEIQPNDVVGIGENYEDFLRIIRDWDKGLKDIIADKIIKKFAKDKVEKISTVSFPTNKLISSVLDLLRKNDIVDSSKKAIFDNFESNKRVNVYIDDLDRGWEGKREDIRRISALLNAVRDISNEMVNVHFKISLRSDVYYLVRTSDESTDKIGGSVIWYTWERHQILALLVKRVETFFGRDASEVDLMAMHQSQMANYLNPIMTQTFEGVGKWENAPVYRILMSLVRNRPRDLVMICTLAARNARKKNRDKILTEDLQAIFEDYSLERVQDAENEFKSELPDIRRLLFALKPSAKKNRKYSESYVYTTNQVEAKIQMAMAKEPFFFSNGLDHPATAEQLHYFLYKINFLTARRKNKDGVIVRKTFEENKYLTGRFVDFGFGWEVHPAYRWALEPDDHDIIYERLELIDFE